MTTATASIGQPPAAKPGFFASLKPQHMVSALVTFFLVMGQWRYQIIKTHTPLAELDRYSTTLRSLTQGRGTYTERFHAYQPVPN